MTEKNDIRNYQRDYINILSKNLIRQLYWNNHYITIKEVYTIQR